MKHIYEKLVKNKTDIIAGMMKYYNNFGNEKKIDNKIEKENLEIKDILTKKDKLLSLLVKEVIPESEFKNVMMNITPKLKGKKKK